MSIIFSEPLVSKGRADAKKHRDKQREILKKSLPDIISEESIIKSDNKGKIIKIPIRSLDLPRFRPATGGSSGIGQGKGKPGDIVGSHPVDGSDPGQAGDRPGIDYIETEVQLEEIIEMMFEDLGLPNLDEKNALQLATSMGYKIHGLKREGSFQLLSRRATAIEGIRRFYGILTILVTESDKDELTCYRALKQAGGNVTEAMAILEENRVTIVDDEVVPFPIIFNEDLRYFKLEELIENESNAVVIAMVDVSGSMSTNKKYLARSALFWLVNFLRHLYDNVEIRFIVHHTEARIVEEEEIFKVGESGGTKCSSAYSLANSLIDSEYATQNWNVFVLHFSDGDNYYDDNVQTIEEIMKLLLKNVSMVGYVEVEDDNYSSSKKNESAMWQILRDNLNLTEEVEDNVLVIAGDIDVPFLGVRIEQKEDLFFALKALLTKTRWQL